jgi:hypothetical protein
MWLGAVEVITLSVSGLVLVFGGSALFCPLQELQKTSTRNKCAIIKIK